MILLYFNETPRTRRQIHVRIVVVVALARFLRGSLVLPPLRALQSRHARPGELRLPVRAVVLGRLGKR